MNIEEFKKWSKEKQKEKIMEYFKIDGDTLIGTVTDRSDKQEKIWISDIHGVNRKEILNNPFNEFEPLKVSVKYRNGDLNINDKIYFKFEINKDCRLEKYPILIKYKNMVKLIDIENSDLPLKEIIIKSLRKKLENENFTKIVYKQEIEQDLINMIEDYNKTLNDLKKESENKLNQLDEKKKKKSKELKEIEGKIEYIQKDKEMLEKYGFTFEENLKVRTVEGKTNVTKNKQVNYIQKYLASRENKKLYYSKEILEQFYAGLCTNQLVILSGQPGTGKTSLVEGFCDAIGANLKIISVQPNWTDNQDLLGFFNPIEGTYISTPFLDAIIEAQSNPEQLHIICLDEMNLAHVEYYFSEFLSKMQSEERKITLYSKYLYEEAREELLQKIMYFIGKMENENSKIEENINTLKKIGFEEHYKLTKKWNSLKRYQHEIEIPDNVRFIGTINKDETTKNLSPKVIDRSYIMEIDNYTKELEEKIENEIKKARTKYNENLYLNSKKFDINVKSIDELQNKIDLIANILKKVDITLSNRLYRQFAELNGSEIFNECDIFDAIVATKILPKINFEIDNKDDIREELKQILSNTSISKEIFGKMNKNSDESGIGILTFWR